MHMDSSVEHELHNYAGFVARIKLFQLVNEAVPPTLGTRPAEKHEN